MGKEESRDSPFEHEYRALRGRIEAQRRQANRLRELADSVEDQTARDEGLLREMEEVLEMAPQLCLDSLDRRLKGQRLREIAVAVLKEHVGVGQDIHYRDWYALLESAGYRIAGKDPLATFLAQLHRAPDIVGRGNRSGLYALANS